MPEPTDEAFQTRLAVAALVACIVRTLGERDEYFQRRFEQHLQTIYGDVRGDGENVGAMETLSLVPKFLKL